MLSFKNVAMDIWWRCLPLAGESWQTHAAVVLLGAVPSVEAAVVPSCARAGGDGEVWKPAGGDKGQQVSDLQRSCRRALGFAAEALTG